MSIKVSKQVNLSSSSATTINFPSNNNCVFFLPNILENQPLCLYSTISLTSAQIPVSYYVVNDYNNTLNITISNTNSIRTLTNGNYTSYTFMDMVLLNLGASFGMEFSKTTGKFTLYNQSYQFTCHSISTCYALFGFSKNESVSSNSNKILVFPYPCNLAGINRIKIRTPNLNLDNMDSRSNGFSQQLVSIPMNAPPYSYVFYENINDFSCLINDDIISKIDIEIVDENENPVNFNGQDWLMTLQIDNYYETPEKKQTLTDFFQSRTL